MKKFPVLILAAAITVSLVGCSSADENKPRYPFGSDRFETSDRLIGTTNEQNAIIVDKETGVMYLWVQRGNAGGLTPLLDENGQVQFYNP